LSASLIGIRLLPAALVPRAPRGLKAVNEKVSPVRPCALSMGKKAETGPPSILAELARSLQR
jgi:hypothetical protein